MRECTKCKMKKPLSNFGKKAKSKDGIHPWCKECSRLESRNFYKKNPEPYKKRSRITCKKLSKLQRTQADQIKLHLGCFCCQETLLCLLDYHHLEEGIPVPRAVSHSRTRFLRELKKCIVVCANCHRKIHAKYITLPDTIETAIHTYYLLFDQSGVIQAKNKV